MGRTMEERCVGRLSLLVLAGGRSRRMGQDKVWLMLDGMPLIERAVRRVLPLAAEVLLSANDCPRCEVLASRFSEDGVPARVVADLHGGAGPLAGLHVGLTVARHDLLLALAADMPFVNLTLVEQMVGLAEGFDAVVPRLPSPDTGALAWEPLHALYRRTCLPAITARLTAGERRVASFYPDVQVREVTVEMVARCDPGGLSLFNVNTPDEWRRVQALALSSDPA